MRSTSLALSLAFAVLACKKPTLTSLDLPKEEIKINYYFNYNSETQRSYCTAIFHQGGTSKTVRLGENSQLLVEGTRVFSSPEASDRYTISFFGRLDSLHTEWQYWTGMDTFRYLNRLHLPPAISASPCYIQTWQAVVLGFDLPFQGQAIAPDEQVTALIEVETPDTSFTLQASASQLGDSSVYLSPQLIQALSGYTPSYHLIRERGKPLEQHSGAGGQASLKYLSRKQFIYFY